MSAYVGFFSPAGRPVDELWLARARRHLDKSAPDGGGQYAGRGFGAAFAWRRLRDGVDAERQPIVCGAARWLIGDVRLDGRGELLAALDDDAPRADRPDVELLAAAYRRWDEDAVQRVLGDFTFATWDEERRRLLAARDALGVRGLYWAETTRGDVVVGNEAGAVLSHPDVDAELDDERVLEWLLTGACTDPERTIYRALHQLPPGHRLVVDERGSRVSRWWDVPAPPTWRPRRAADVVDAFRHTLELAVRDRVRDADGVVVSMSGGTDSTALAALAARLRAADGFSLAAVTVGLLDDARDREPRFAALAASACGVPHEVVGADDVRWLAGWDAPAEPHVWPNAELVPVGERVANALAARGRVVLDGSFGDPLQMGSPSAVRDALANEGARGLVSVLRSIVLHGKRPAFGWGARFGADEPVPLVPAWLARGQRASCDPEAMQVAAIARALPPAPAAQAHPRTYLREQCTRWGSAFHDQRPEELQRPLCTRYPFADLRLVELALSIPLLPWTLDKELLRASTRQLLPDEVRLRPKAPYRPVLRHTLSDVDSQRLAALLEAAPEADRWLDRARLRQRLRPGARLSYGVWSPVFQALALLRYLQAGSGLSAASTHVA